MFCIFPPRSCENHTMFSYTEPRHWSTFILIALQPSKFFDWFNIQRVWFWLVLIAYTARAILVPINKNSLGPPPSWLIKFDHPGEYHIWRWGANSVRMTVGEKISTRRVSSWGRPAALTWWITDFNTIQDKRTKYDVDVRHSPKVNSRL